MAGEQRHAMHACMRVAKHSRQQQQQAAAAAGGRRRQWQQQGSAQSAEHQHARWKHDRSTSAVASSSSSLAIAAAVAAPPRAATLRCASKCNARHALPTAALPSSLIAAAGGQQQQQQGWLSRPTTHTHPAHHTCAPLVLLLPLPTHSTPIRLSKLDITCPIKQHAYGTKGQYRAILVEAKTLNADQFKAIAEVGGACGLWAPRWLCESV
jgi:hypothetical protein